VRTAELSDGTVAIGFSALVSEEGTLLNAESIEKPHSSAREYDSMLVRYFDTYFRKERSTLWYTILEYREHRYKLSTGPLINALESTDYIFPTWPVDSPDEGEFQLSSRGLLFLALDPKRNPAKAVAQKLWYVEVVDFTKPPYKIHPISCDFDGIFTSPIWAKDGQSMAFLATESSMIPGTFNRIFVIHPVNHESKAVEVIPVRKEKWNLNVNSLAFSDDGSELYVIAEERARQKLWKLPIKNTTSTVKVAPTLLSADTGSVSAVFPISSDIECKKILINSTSLVDNGSFVITETATKCTKSFAKFALNDLALGVQRSQVSDITFKGAGDYEVQAWVFRPSNFDESKTYPLAFLIHGGPVGTWGDAWSTRWNPAVWAEQGYVVMLPNP
jgi:dipeptidyl aminopeptidase/acylaminoacyl peptidase